MKKKLTFIMILAVLALTSCSDFLDRYPDSAIPEKRRHEDIGRLQRSCDRYL